MTKNDFLGFLHAGDFKQLFLECGWNNPTTTDAYPIPVGEETYSVSEVAQKGLKIYVCKVEKMPEASVRRQIDSKLRKLSHDYFLIFVSTAEEFHHLWSVPVKSVDKRQLVTIEYVQDDQVAFLLEKVNAISFSFDEEPTIVDVVDRVNAAFLVNTTEVTEEFYQGFKKQRNQFVKGILGITGDQDRQWYASVMLNRLMFCYFIQKKGFLNQDENYLGNKLKWVQKTRGENKFDSFYRSFLRNLFKDGLDNPLKKRTKYFITTYGRIPYLNGGMFAEHRLECENKELDIPDKVFEKLFEFFDQWHWHLDNRLTASGRDINPDVLGYIFEQYINDRAQMGAYYTKEDITEYIGRNCILPYLFGKVLGRARTPSASAKWIWDYLRKSGDKYIFAAVRKGAELPLPDYIERGVSTVGRDLLARRSRWNEKADEAYALPTEIWRETVARRQRYAEVRDKIEKGEITDIHDFITYNLDIRSFAEDILRETDDHHLVALFYKAVREVTVLDPACGSGAFLFAALNILEPLYEICLDRMEEFHGKNGKLFKDELAEIKDKFRSNQKYFIYKNIILRNLYGVDIMHEATEIARLRLFLKMMAVVDVDPYDENLGLDPLPDIDFNVKCGNTLVGYASEQEIQDGLTTGDKFSWTELKRKIDDELMKVSMSFKYFRDQQLDLSPDNLTLAETKVEVKKRLAVIRTRLDHIYGSGSGEKQNQWLSDTQPFHWYAEFYPVIVGKGGFDVIIGNPPYIKNSEVERIYPLSGYATISSQNVYTIFIERATALCNENGYVSFIVQLPLVCTDGMAVAQRFMQENFGGLYYATFDDRPGKLFDQLEHIRATIFIGIKRNGGSLRTTCFNRWMTESRNILFQLIAYHRPHELQYSGSIAKIGTFLEERILTKLLSCVDRFGDRKDEDGLGVYYHNAPLYWIRGTSFIPFFRNDRGDRVSSQIKLYGVRTQSDLDLLVGVLNSSLFYFWYITFSDTRHLNVREIDRFPVVSMTQNQRTRLCTATSQLMVGYEKYKERKSTTYKTTGKVEYDEYHPGASKELIDRVDCVLAEIYGLNAAEQDAIQNFNYKFRMGQYLRKENA